MPHHNQPLMGFRHLLAAFTPPEVPDGVLLERFVGAADQAAFGALVHRHAMMVLGVCRRLLNSPEDAEDICQATFLLLAEKAARIRKADSVGSWLHGTARRLASDLRAKAARRATRPLPREPALPGSDPARALTAEELLAALDEELGRLPDKFRAPLVLCYMEGRTRDEAALQLGWPVGAVRGRLERGRNVLRKRLLRRGLSLPVVLATAGLAEAGWTAGPTLMMRIVSAVAAGSPADPAAGGLVELLSRGATVMSRKLKLGLAVAVMAAFVAGIGMYLGGAFRGDILDAPLAGEAWAADQPLSGVPAEAKVELSGRVVGPDGNPVAGATVTAVTPFPAALADRSAPAVTTADGTFRLSVPRAELALQLGAGQVANLVATADGHGLGWGPAGDFLPEGEPGAGRRKDPVLRLVKDDAPLVGQIKTADGKPAAGARVELGMLWSNDKEDLAPWLDAVRRGDQFGEAERHLNRFLAGPGLARIAAKADAAGKFRLAGIGRGRLAALEVSGPTVAYTGVVARTEPGGAVTVNGLTNALLWPDALGCFAAEMTLTLPPSRAAEVAVTDADTGRPVAGARVTSLKLAGTDFYRPNDHLSGRTDGAGRVRLEGLPVGRENLLLVLAPDGQPYLPAGLTADTTKGGDPVALGVRIRRGVWVEGRVTDAKSGRPLLAAVDVFYPEGNPNLARYPDLYVWGGMQRTDGTGHFRVPAVAGRAVVAVRLSGRDVPSRGQPAVAQAGRNYPLLKAVKLDGLSDKPLAIYRVVRPPRPLTSIDYHQIRSIEVPADKPTVECNFAIE